MIQSSTKRHASRSPDSARLGKRPATSSPEEGELDDGTPPSPPQHSLPPEPPSPLRLPAKAKVPFPFKKRPESVKNVTGVESKDKVPPVVYERSVEDERRIREADMKRKPSRLGQTDTRRGGQPVADHWNPSMGYGRDRNSRGVRSTGWDVDHINDRHQSTYVSRDRDNTTREWHTDHDYPVPSTSSRGHYRDRDRDRARPSLSPVSGNRSGSPPSPTTSTRREKHRLPPPRSPEPNFSPPRRDYGVDRIRDRERQRDGLDRSKRYRDDDDDDNDDDRSYPRDDARHHASREWTRDHYPREVAGNKDYYRQPERDPRPKNYPRDDRAWSHEISYDGDHRSRPHDDRNLHRTTDNYQPASPVPHRSRSLTPHRRRSPTLGPQTPPPPPSSSPPPPPPPIDPDLPKGQTLPPEHEMVSIVMKRPGAPKEIHSPPSLPHPAKPVNGKDRNDADKDEDGAKEREREVEKLNQAKAIAQIRRHEPIRRSPQDEERAYGRVFKGCGNQRDYEVTTKLGEGTFGEVHKAIHKATGAAVALKRILMHNEKEGVPVTALREIKILKAMKHPCIVNILDMFVVRTKGKQTLSVYMVFPYMDHDLAGLLENERVKLQPSHIKLYMKQLLEGTEYMHRNHILHRDMKAANLLISNSGSLRIADFGLARAFDPNIIRGGEHRGKERKYTNCVVTRWYRPPELLLGARQYGGEVDIWGIGCVLGEMFSRRPILTGTSDLDQLEKIWQLCGTPNQHNWPNHDALPGCEGVKRFNSSHSRKIRQAYESVGAETCDLLDKLLVCNPRERITASQALDHDYFWTDPLPADPKTLPSYEASHEFDRRGRRNQHMPIVPVQQQGDRPFRPPPVPGPMQFGRGPAREMFRSGPPPLHRGPVPNIHYPLPLAPNMPGQMPHHPQFPYPPPMPPHVYQQHQGPNAGPERPPPHRQGPPQGPGQQHRPPDRWEPSKERPSHLPPRPPAPQGRGGGGGRTGGNYTRGGYGGRGGPPNHNAHPNGWGGPVGELNYG